MRNEIEISAAVYKVTAFPKVEILVSPLCATCTFRNAEGVILASGTASVPVHGVSLAKGIAVSRALADLGISSRP
jgi:hypothetical protein